MRKPPNKRFAPMVIAGVTIGFLAAAYQFVFGQKSVKTDQQDAATAQPVQDQDDAARVSTSATHSTQ